MNPNQASAPKKEPSIVRANNRLVDAINLNAKLVAELRDRVHVALQPTEPDGGVKTVGEPREAMCALADQMMDRAAQVEQNNTALRALIDLVELPL
jgi:hypothetical protein